MTTNPDDPRDEKYSYMAPPPEPRLGCGYFLGVLREIAAEQRECEAQCIHAPKAKAMYARRAAEIESAIGRAVAALDSASAAYSAHCDKVVAALNEGRSGDAAWSQQHADYTKGKRDALRDILS